MMGNIYTDLCNKMVLDFDNTIKAALKEKGFDRFDEQFIKDNFTFLQLPNDDYKHLYYRLGQSEEQRVISIEKQPRFIYHQDERSVFITAEQNVY